MQISVGIHIVHCALSCILLPRNLALKSIFASSSFWSRRISVEMAHIDGMLERLLPLDGTVKLRQRIAQNQIGILPLENLLLLQPASFVKNAINHTKLYSVKPSLIAEIEQTDQPTVVAPVHFSTFYNNIAALGALSKGRRSIYILVVGRISQRIKKLKDVCDKKTNLKIEWVNIDIRKDFFRSIKQAKKEKAIVVCFCDLSGVYGKTVEGMFLGKNARFAVGHLRVAEILQCNVIFSYCLTSIWEYNPTIYLNDHHQSFSKDDCRKEWYLEGTRKSIQCLETAINAKPELWAHWSDLSDYYDSYERMCFDGVI